MSSDQFFVMADVNINSGNVHINSMNVIDRPPIVLRFEIDNTTLLTDGTIESRIQDKIIGTYNYFTNFYVNDKNTIILFHNNKWIIILNIDNNLYSFSNDKIRPTTYMDIKDIQELLTKFNNDITMITDGVLIPIPHDLTKIAWRDFTVTTAMRK